MKTSIYSIVLLALVLMTGALWLPAQRLPQVTPQERQPSDGARLVASSSIPTIGTPSISLSSFPVHTPTTLTITCLITDQRLIAGSVNLLRLGAAGVQPTILGAMHDDGTAGDLKAGDHLFTVQVSLNETYPSTINLQVSAAFTGLLSRISSVPVSVQSTGLTISNVADASPIIVQGTVTGKSSYYQGVLIVTDLQLAISRVIKGTVPTAAITVSILGGVIGNDDQTPEGASPLLIGDPIVLFLETPGSDGKYSLSVGTLGFFHLRTNADGSLRAVVDGGATFTASAYPLDPTFITLLQQSKAGLLSIDTLLAAVTGI